MTRTLRRLSTLVLAVTIGWIAAPPVDAQSMQALMEGAKREAKLVSYGMSDDWVNLENIFAAIEKKYGVKHTDTDMTSAEQITRLLAERSAPVMDIADIGYDFLGKLIENNLAMPYRNSSWDKIPNNFKDPEGRWAVASGAPSASWSTPTW
jgi:putative spermidine/putrescine transport system substrate-binding protein